MPLSESATREPVHTRQVVCRGYHRADGLWDVEGHLTDTKTYDFDTQYRGLVHAGEPVHEMWIRLTLDDELVIRDVTAVMDHNPFPTCPAITPNFSRIKGLSIKPGFHAKLRELLGGVEGCTHLVEMMGPVATTAFQTIYPYRERLRRQTGEKSARRPGARPPLLDTCHSFSSRGVIVKEIWPEFYKGD
jgi:hypothetical protein